jgi:omega-amidase
LEGIKSKLHCTLLQVPLEWEAPEKNRALLENYLQSVGVTDLILLPEMFTSGFTMHPERVAEPMKGYTLNWMQQWAQKKGALVGGSLVIEEQGQYFNRFVMVGSQGCVSYYDKRHTFTLAGEDKAYTTGTNTGLFEYNGWKICMRICYDLRFPVWSRNTSDYDLLIYVANWPKPRILAWDTLLQARAIENMSYVVGVNRVGTDEKGHEYPGHSAAYDALGHCCSEGDSTAQGVHSATLDYQELQAHRKKLRFLEDRDNFDLY